MLKLELDMIQAIGLAVILLIIGRDLRRRIGFFEKYCIPAPVIGGFLFAIITFIFKQSNILEIKFDTTLQQFFMVMFFTSVGFNASLQVLKKGGKKVFTFLLAAIGLVILQNLLAVGLAPFVGLHPLLALMTGSTPMTGGHGTAAAIAPTVEALGFKGADTASTIAIAAATFGLIGGSMIGGPIADRLIKKNNLLPTDIINERKNEHFEKKDIDENVRKEDLPILDAEKFSYAFFYILIAMGLGSYLSIILKALLPALSLPVYIGPMIVAAIMRNIFDASEKLHAPIHEISVIEDVSLNLFLAMALMSLKLWQLIDLAIPVIILLLAQVVLIYFYLIFVTFKVMGSDYDAAVMVSGHAGFGLGATPNGIANMRSVTEKYIYSKVAFFVIPLVGALFIDFFNVSIITMFVSFFK